ncbi:MAG: hypothetical protein M0Z58_05170 [Nitrospiraceae bacterium]|nr:hypothetical protein [Nitrospiraceae bacterium]
MGPDAPKRAVFKIFAAAACLLFIAGCQTVNLNRAVTGTACATRSRCLKDMNLPNPAAPRYVFVVGPYTFNETAKGSLGTSFGTTYRGDVELCVARALAREFGDRAKVVFDSKGLAGPYAGIRITRADFHSDYTMGWHMQIDYTLTYGGKSVPLAARTGIKNFLSARQAAETQYLAACGILARQVKENLGGMGIDSSKEVIH